MLILLSAVCISRISSGYQTLFTLKSDSSVEIDASLRQSSSDGEVSDASSDTAVTVININTADVNELKNLPGIGTAKAEAIIRYREKNGSFSSVDEIKNVTGVGDGIFEDIKDMICVDCS